MQLSETAALMIWLAVIVVIVIWWRVMRSRAIERQRRRWLSGG